MQPFPVLLTAPCAMPLVFQQLSPRDCRLKAAELLRSTLPHRRQGLPQVLSLLWPFGQHLQLLERCLVLQLRWLLRFAPALLLLSAFARRAFLLRGSEGVGSDAAASLRFERLVSIRCAMPSSQSQTTANCLAGDVDVRVDLALLLASSPCKFDLTS